MENTSNVFVILWSFASVKFYFNDLNRPKVGHFMGRFSDLPKDVVWLIFGPVFARELFHTYHLVTSNQVIKLNTKDFCRFEYPAHPNRSTTVG